MNKSQVVGSPIMGAGIKLAVGASSVATTNLPSGHVVRVVSTVPCFVAVGLNANAAADTGLYLAAGIPEYFYIPHRARLAVIQAAGAGFLYASPMA